MAADVPSPPPDPVQPDATAGRHPRQGIDMIAGMKRVAIALVVVTIVGAAGFYGWRWYDSSRDVEVADNAYVRGEITNVSSRVTGYAVEVLVDDNIPVKPAQLLARIDPRDFRIAVEKAQAALDQA